MILLVALATPVALADTSVLRATPVVSQIVRELMDRWAATQNRGDFASYDSLYASNFHGQRKSGVRSVDLDRVGWMTDRERMFKKAMTVSVSDLAPLTEAAGNCVTFVQEFQSGSYHDRGRKEICFVDEGAGLHIVREKMLSSEIVRATAQSAVNKELEVRFESADERLEADGACTGLQDLVLEGRRSGEESRLVLSAECGALCGCRARPEDICGEDRIAWSEVQTLTWGSRQFMLLRKIENHTRTNGGVPPDRVTYAVYGFGCGRLGELLVVKSGKQEVAVQIETSGTGPEAWQSIRVRTGSQVKPYHWSESACHWQ